MSIPLSQSHFGTAFFMPEASSDVARYERIMKFSCLLAGLIHLFFLLLFRYFGAVEMAALNLYFSIPLYLLAFLAAHFRKFNLVALLNFGELIVHAVVATFYLGLYTGFHIYLLLPVILSFIFYKYPIVERVLISVFFSLAYFGFYIWTSGRYSDSPLPSWLGHAFFLFNLSVFVGFTSLMIFLFVKEAFRMEQKILDANEELTLQKQEIGEQRNALMRQKEELEYQRDRVNESIQYAQQLQKAVIPSPEILSPYVEDYFLLERPCNVVSGDFFWLKVVEGKLMLLLADCTGHGVPGAFMSMLAIGLMENVAKDFGAADPALLMDELRRRMKAALGKGEQLDLGQEGMDGAILIFDPERYELEYSGAYNPVWVIGQQGLQIIKGSRQPVGAHVVEIPFVSHTVKLNKGDAVYLFTDGFCDQVNGKSGEKMKLKRFKSELMKYSGLPMEGQSKALETFFNDWQQGGEQVDDFMVFGFRV
ncbi:PP2C family protein-serine/threonine phosphatase [Persicobacter sp. CCB-QB2]|uniref:PP2C family protein-serine/threonine phosphatase n=1 Tax=Persicobacter sp. CCB-QB2 TaxID=1561025 RepID=UPI0009E302D2|nr:SpoIIE family protein phosphatase [Persicobacter sp. CCB-QB2]